MQCLSERVAVPCGAGAWLEPHERTDPGAGAGASMIGSCQTVPVNDSAGIRRDGIEPNGLISMNCPSLRYPAVLALIGGG